MILDVRAYGETLTLHGLNVIMERVHQSNTIPIEGSVATLQMEITKIFCTNWQAQHLFCAQGRGVTRYWRNYNGVQICVMEDI